MRDFIRILKRFVPPYKKYMVLNIVFNVLSAILNLFSFALIIPILQILFKMDEGNYTFMNTNDFALTILLGIKKFLAWIGILTREAGSRGKPCRS